MKQGMNKRAFSLRSLVVIGLMGWSVASYAQSYNISHNQVFFGHEPLRHADSHSFMDLGFGYAKDRNNVYLNGRILEYVDPSTFRLKGHGGPHFEHHRDRRDYDREYRGYYKSDFNVFYGNQKIDASPGSFEEIGYGYAKDAFSVFYDGRKLDASPNSFKLLEGGYAKDAFSVFYEGRKVEGASAGTFKYMGDGYAKDALNDFYRGRKL